MSFYDTLREYDTFPFDEFMAERSEHDARRALAKDRLDRLDFLTLLSPAAQPLLEEMAQKAHDITVRQFGRTILFFTPLYLSNFCTNHCVYCGFSAKTGIPRLHLTPEEVEEEAKAIAATGLKHLLILTGEAPKIATVEYLEDCMQVLKKRFPSVSIEVYAMDQDGYDRMAEAGVDGLTIYQETYNEELYAELHPKGPKRDYRFRLDAPERGCIAGLRGVNIGALLGLDDWRKESFFTGLHAAWLQDRYPETEISISQPRMRPHAGSYTPACVVSDREMVQIMLAQRIFLPRAGITVSTRESAEFRNSILPLGVTKMSAGVSTAVGGHSGKKEESIGQFDISDARGVQEMYDAIRKLGYQPVFKDWQPF